ncbi:Blue-light-activated protein [Jannaschia rubra]|uniref:histidine kinase n=1 Tax=Jannaschia rubra TaxID=282197 RepID=A0A0M6XV67_9RHOB|nr:Blue-light-activated protein [Jannaschia rubra]SFG22000.1 Signal transduction histidine kinase [Jannaschia rubra]
MAGVDDSITLERPARRGLSTGSGSAAFDRTELLRRRLSDFISVEKGQKTAHVTRRVLVVVAAVTMTVFGASPLMLPIAAVFLVIDMIYGRQVAQVSVRPAPEVGDLTRLRVLHAMTMLCLAAMIVVNAFHGTNVSQNAAALLLFAFSMNCIGHDSRSADASVVTLAIITVTMQLMAVGIALQEGHETTDQVFLHLGMAMATLYLIHVTLEAVATRTHLIDRTDELSHARTAETVGRLTSGIAHDFNNLLTVMRGNIDLLAEVPDADRAALLKEIGAATDRGGRLVRQLLDKGRRRPDRSETIVLDRFMDDFATFARRVLPANVRLEVDASASLRLETDPARFEAALLNLVVNSRDALTEGGTITVSARRASAPGTDASLSNWIAVTVADDGSGMSPEVLARATEAFLTTKPPGKGTGMGLAMVRDFAERSGGRLDLESVPSEGTKARLLLPA